MNTITATGFFTMDDVKVIEKMKSLIEAKEFAVRKVEQMPDATKDNKFKAKNAINKARTIPSLMFVVCNFVLAHPSEHLKVIR